MPLQLQNVLITDEVDPKCVDILKSNGVNVVLNTKLAKDKAALLAEIPKYDGLVVRSATKVTADVIEASNLSIIGRAGTGTDNIDSEAATKKGVIVMNTPGGNTISAAELTCAMICALSRNLGAACISMKEGRWDRKLFMGEELQGKTLAIIGLGRIGREVGSRMRSFGMKTIGYDPLVSAEDSAKFDVTSYPLDKIWPMADYITVHVPLLPATTNLIDSKVLGKCKKGVKIINCARGGIIDESALLDALNSGQCGGAGLDVFVEEPPKNLDLVKHPNVIPTPHLGASTEEAQSRVAEEIAQQFIDARDGKSLFGAINANAMVHAMSPASQPLVELGRCLGVLVGSSKKSTNETLKLEVTGDCSMKQSLSFLRAAISAGFLSTVLSSKMNLINAPALAKSAGLQVEAIYTEGKENFVTVSLDKLSVTGFVQGNLCVISKVNSTSINALLNKGASYILLQGLDDTQAVIADLYSRQTPVVALSTSQDKGDQTLLVQLGGSAQLDDLKLNANTLRVIFNL